MPDPLISVITPSLNAGRYIQQAIESVISQNYANFEHIVVDGGSTDRTLDVIAANPHIRSVSEPDLGQSDAMNKGFQMSRGDFLVYLNADDYFLPSAFRAVGRAVQEGGHLIMGKVKVIRDNGQSFINDPKVELLDMLRWWRDDAYCYNSAGYFYRREIQERVGPFNIRDHYTMDFEFLIKASRLCRFTRVPDLLACFRLVPGTKTHENQRGEFATFQRFMKYLEFLPEADREQVHAEWMAQKSH